MPNIKSAKKRVVVNEKKNLENRMVKSTVKTAIRKYNDALASGDVAAAEKLLPGNRFGDRFRRFQGNPA